MASDPITREEMLLNAVATGVSSGIEPITREEMYLAYIGGQDVVPPDPITRKEQFLSKIAPGGGSGVIISNQDKTITENGTYTADAGYTGLGEVTVAVPIPDVEEIFISPYGVGYTANMVLDCAKVGCTWGGADNLKSLTLTEWNPTYADRLEMEGKASGAYLFKTSSLETLILPKVQYCGHRWAGYATGLKTVQLGSVGFPMLTSIGSLCFTGCTQSDLTITVYVDATTLADAKAITGDPPWGATNATVIYRNSTTGEVISE